MSNSNDMRSKNSSPGGVNDHGSSAKNPAVRSGPVGIVSTWGQECGLATYAQFMVSAYPSGTYIVLAEHTNEPLTKPDESFVTRCWSRSSSDYRKLGDAIEAHGIGLIHLNCQARFFHQPQFVSFLNQIRSKGVKVVAHVHNLFTIEDHLKAIVSNVDRVVTHSPENELEAIANGCTTQNVVSVPHGVTTRSILSDSERFALRKRLGMPSETPILVSFGFIQPHKGMEGLIESLAHLKQRGVYAVGYIAGKPNESDPQSKSYAEWLLSRAREMGVEDRFTILNRFLTEEEVVQYLQAADVVLMNYRSQHYEASGACSLAVGAGALVATSVAPPFAPFGKAVWHITSGYPVQLSIEILLTNTELRDTIRRNAQAYAHKYSWENIAPQIFSMYQSLGYEPKAPKKETAVNTTTPLWKPTHAPTLRVLLQNRPNTFTQPGGDTIVIERTVAALKARGVSVEVDVEGRLDPRHFDVVHLFNFALPELTRQFAERAVQAGVPYVVTTLYEDVPSFHNQSRTLSEKLVEYVRRGQDSNWYENLAFDVRQVPPCRSFDNSWTAQHAAALITNGARESKTIRRDYPGATKVIEVPLGCEVTAVQSPEAFVREYGIRDFILCVGRLESRKNQLMLLKALESSPLPVVCAAGGFTYQPDYADAVKAFKRKGQTLILGRLSPEMLGSAYAAARMHVLPSWYELPGLVTLEAAWYGSNVVATGSGTAPDYLGERAFYCDPADSHSIYNAVMAAYYSPRVEGLSAHARTFTWDRCAERTLEVYQLVARRAATSSQAVAVSVPSTQGTIVASMPSVSAPMPATLAHPGSGIVTAPGSTPFQHQTIPVARPTFPPAGAASPTIQTPVKTSGGEFERITALGEEAARAGRFKDAHQHMAQLELLEPNSSRAFRARAAIYLAESNEAVARSYFERALKIDPSDAKSLCGRGMCDMQVGRLNEAYQGFVTALEKDPVLITAIHQLIRCSYALNRFSDLERALRKYVSANPQDIDMEFCLAGCLYKGGNRSEAESVVSRILTRKPDHKGALELCDVIRKEKNTPAAPQVSSQTAPQATPRWVAPSQTGSVSGAGAPVQATAPSSNTVHSFDDVDQKLVGLEEMKRQRRYDEVRAGVKEVLSNTQVRADQRERASLLGAEISVLQNDLVSAQNTFDNVLRENPSSARALCGKGALAAHQGNLEQAKTFFEQALRSDAQYDVALAGMGLCAAHRGDREGAWGHYTAALKSNPENLRALYGLVEVGYPMQRHAEIESAIKNYLEMHPADLEFSYTLAGCYYAQNKLQEAKREVEKIILFEPNHQRARELDTMIAQRATGAPAAQRAF